MGSLNLSLDVPCCRLVMWTYLVLYSVKWKYWIDPCRENETLLYMPTTLINGKFELVPWCETWYVNLFGFVFGKMKVLECPLSENEILAYMVIILINMKVEPVPWFKIWYLNLFGFKFGKMKVLKWPLSRSLINGKFELVPWRPLLQTCYVNLFGFVFGKMKVLDWPLSRKWDFALSAYNFYKLDVWTCPFMRNMICEPIWFWIR